MKVTYNWLEDFVDIRLPPEALADKLTMAGLEVVSLEKAGSDWVFEIEITSNRPDWLSVLGIAREISAITGKKLKEVKPKEQKASSSQLKAVKISIEDKKGCPFYSARIICGVKIGPSPQWLKERLELLGCRSVNNVVDITNYVLFELGHPLHVFDLDLLAGGEIVVRRAKAGEKMTTLDGQPRPLSPDILVIADRERPQAIAGIMGGSETEVTAKTRNILLESAVFDPVLIRRTRQKLGMQSESAYRFERGVNAENAKLASLAAQELICKLASGKPCTHKSVGIIKSAVAPIKLDADYMERILGSRISAPKINRILKCLGFGLKQAAKNTFLVKVPAFRQDTKSAIDLVEEVGRIHGYPQIKQTLPAIKPNLDIGGENDAVPCVKNVLAALGLREAITYSLVDRDILEKSGIKDQGQPVEILNPLSREQEILRPSILPSLIRCVAYNLDRQQEYVGIFEIAGVFSKSADTPKESISLGIALCGTHSIFTGAGLVRDEVTLLHLKGILGSLFNKLGVRGYAFEDKGQEGIAVSINGREAGAMFDLNKRSLDAFGIKNRRVYLAQVDLAKVFSHISRDKQFVSLPRYPAITRDISFIIKDDVPVQGLLSAMEESGQPLLRSARIVDYYRGRQIPAGFRGLTVSCVYRANDRTLTEEELSPLHNRVRSLLEERFGIKLRQD